MTAEEKVLKYLKGRKTPATQAQIARGAKVNPNTLRRILGGLRWRAEQYGYICLMNGYPLTKAATDNGFVYVIA